MLDFYTIETSVDLTQHPDVVDALVQHIGYFCQPEIIGTPYGEEGEEGDTFFLRFAVRHGGLVEMEKDFVKLLRIHFHDHVELRKMRDL